MAERPRFRACLWVVVVVVGVTAALTAALYPAVRAARIAAWRSQRGNNLKQVGMALYNFHDAYRHLPAVVRRCLKPTHADHRSSRSTSYWRL